MPDSLQKFQEQWPLSEDLHGESAERMKEIKFNGDKNVNYFSLTWDYRNNTFFLLGGTTLVQHKLQCKT